MAAWAPISGKQKLQVNESMRPGQQNKRGRGRGGSNNNNGGGGGNNFNRKGGNPLTRTYDSSGPDVKIRGTAQHIAEKYSTLARDSQSAGDRVMAENYLQHAEHYYRIVSAAQAQMPQPQQIYRADGDDDGDEDRPMGGQHPYPQFRGDQAAFGPSDPQPYVNGNGHGGERDDHGDGDGDDGDDQPAMAEAQPHAESGDAAVAEGDQAPREGRSRSRRRRPYRDRDRTAGEGGAAQEGSAPVDAGGE